jgi:hypothetical protein
VRKVTTRSLYPECIANLKLPIDTFYRESRSGVNIAKRNITTGLFGLKRGLKYFISPTSQKPGKMNQSESRIQKETTNYNHRNMKPARP